MRKLMMLAGVACLALGAPSAHADNRYSARPPVVVSPDLSAPWVMQLQRRPATGQPVHRALPAGVSVGLAPAPRYRVQQRQLQTDPVRTSAYVARPVPQPMPEKRTMNPMFLPQVVDYDSAHAPGTIIVDSSAKFLYLIEGDGKARRYGVGTAKSGFEWKGTHKVTNKREWPEWRPPAEMIQRVKREEGRTLPAVMAGGPANPLGSRALYLGSTLYRIHGTNAPWTIGQNVSSGCIRMRNEDVADLYGRVKVGTKVIMQ
jgi:lipoprotein-anchoring transpeptidase ErfK/SrfK